VLDNLRLIFSLTFHRNKFGYDFVGNLTAHLLEKESALKIKKKKSYSQNTQRSISPGAPVTFLQPLAFEIEPK
jgi:hypothetical protein